MLVPNNTGQSEQLNSQHKALPFKEHRIKNNFRDANDREIPFKKKKKKNYKYQEERI